MTKNYIGIDLGTSSVKLLLVGEDGAVKKEAHREYPLYLSEGARSEQEPLDWLTKTEEALEELLSDTPRESVFGVAVAGQMHGLVLLDENDKLIGGVYCYRDERTNSALKDVRSLISDEELSAEYIIPRAFDERVGKTVAKAVYDAAVKSGVSRI